MEGDGVGARPDPKFQLCTVRRDGRPHVTPVLAIWALGAMWFTTGDNEVQPAKGFAFATCSESSQTRYQWR